MGFALLYYGSIVIAVRAHQGRGGEIREVIAAVAADSQRGSAAELARARDIYRPVAGWYDYFDYLTYVWGVPTTGKLLRTHDEWFDKGTPVVFELQDDA